MTRDVKIGLLDEIRDGCNRHDVDAILSHFAADCDWSMARRPSAPKGRRCLGKIEIGEVLRWCYGQITDLRWEEMRHWICNPIRGGRGTPVGGTVFEYLGCDLWEFRDGFVTKKDIYWKFIG